MSFYSTVKHFDTALDDSKIKVKPFLEASEGIVCLVEKFGRAFTPVRSDIEGNIGKVRSKYQEDTSRFENFYEIMADEAEKDESGKKRPSSEGGLWLSRGLKFMCKFMEVLVENHKNNKSEDSLRAPITTAYEASLKAFHGLLVKGTFSLVARAAPSRKSLMTSLNNSDNNLEEDQIMKEMEEYQKKMVPVLAILDGYFKEFGMDGQKA